MFTNIYTNSKRKYHFVLTIIRLLLELALFIQTYLSHYLQSSWYACDFRASKPVKMSSRKTKGKGTTKKRAQRATSNVFAMFDQAQIQEFKEAFNMIDQNRDGFIDKEDLHDMLASLGKLVCREKRNSYIMIKVSKLHIEPQHDKINKLAYCISLLIRCIFFPFQNNPKKSKSILKNSTRSLGLFWKGKTHITAKLHRTDLVIYTHSREGKIPSYRRINMVCAQPDRSSHC